MTSFVQRRVARKLLVAVWVPSGAVAALGLLWLRAETREIAPGLWHAVAAFVALLAATTIGVHFAAVARIVNRPLRDMTAALRRARQTGFLARVPVIGSDEVAELAESFNAGLAAITDLNAKRTDDALAIDAMKRELALNAELEEQHRLLDQANRRVESRLRESTLLFDLTRTLNATLDVDAICNAVTGLVGERLGFSAFVLLLLDEARGDLVVRSAFGVDARAVGSRLPLGAGAAGLAAHERQTVVSPDVHADARREVADWLPAGPGSLVATPMVHQGRCVGVLDFYRPERDAFTPEEQRFLELVAAQAGMAITNARLHERAVALALTDPLTGAANRRALFQRLELELERAERFGHAFAVAMIDVDRFGELNDTHGHLAGDAVLKQVAEILQDGVRKVDLLARHGGEEFAILLARADRDAAVAVAEKLRALVAAAGMVNDGSESGRVTISVGIATYPDDAREGDALLDAADAALFAAKRSGRDAVRAHEPGMREDPLRRRDVRVTSAVEPA